MNPIIFLDFIWFETESFRFYLFLTEILANLLSYQKVGSRSII